MNEKMLIKFKERSVWFLVAIIVIGCLLRVVAINKFPIGLNCDEASSAYDAYSILNYGIDRNGNFLPVFLEAWGSGQNALYSYMIIPFLFIFGLNIFATRLPMAILGCISLVVWYFLLKKINNNRLFNYIGLIFLCICPWHIMKSRWGLESNVFPELALYAVYLIISFLNSKKSYKLYIAFGILGLCGYSYGTSYFFLPIFCVILCIYLFIKKQMSIKEIIISFLIIFVVALPIMLYVVINTFDLEQINLPFLTVPKLGINRYEEQTTLFSGNIFVNAYTNFKNSISLIFEQNDGLAWNSISGIGMYYYPSVLFLIVGLVFSFKKSKYKFEYDNIMNIWFISAFLLMFVFVDANINRINILVFPLIYYIIKGIYVIFDITEIKVHCVIIAIFIASFAMFCIKYVNMNINDYWTFVDGVEEAIKYADSTASEKVIVDYSFKEPYIFVLYYTKADTNEFVNTVKYFNGVNNFESVSGFGKFEFNRSIVLEKNEDYVYIVKNSKLNNIDLNDWNIKNFGEYSVLQYIQND